MWKAKIDYSKTRQNSDPAQPCKQERYHSYPENLLEPNWGWCIWQHYSPQTAWSWPFCSGSKEKTSSNWRTSPEETWLCQSSCGLDLGGLVLCFVDWWISLHSIRIWWQGLRETKATWGVQELLHSANCEVWWWWVTVWGAMSYRGTGLMKRIEGNLNSQGYIDILENYAVPSAHLLGYGDNYFYMDDNAPCHRSKVVKDWMANNNLRSLIWPPQSPDLNPIENLWRDLGIAKKHIRTPNCTELFQVLSTAWDNIPVQRCQDLIRSMPRRMQAVIAARGGYTKYWD